MGVLLAVAVAVAVVILIVAALAIPLSLDVDIDLADRLRVEARLRWLFDLVRIPLHRGPEPARPPTAATRARHARARHADGRPSRRPPVLAILSTRGLAGRMHRLLQDMRGAIRVRRMVIRARFGFDDPADTGRACGAVLPLAALGVANGMDIRCTPDFAHAILRGHCAGTVSVTPLRIVAAIVSFIASPPVWRAARMWRRRR